MYRRRGRDVPGAVPVSTGTAPQYSPPISMGEDAADQFSLDGAMFTDCRAAYNATVWGRNVGVKH